MLTNCTSLSVLPNTWTMAPGATLQLQALAQCPGVGLETVTSSASTTWTVATSGGSATGSVTSAGVFTAGSVDGVVYVQAVYQPAGSTPVSDSATVTVSGNSVVSLSLAPNSAVLHPGSYQAFTATATFDGGSTQDVSLEATWGSDAPDIVSEPCDLEPGRACALDAGAANVLATYRGLTASAPVTVLAASTVTSLSVSPASTDLPQGPGTCAELQATATFSDGTSGPVPADWSSPDASLDGGLLLAPQQNSASTDVCLAPNLPVGAYDVTATADAQDGTAVFNICATTAHLVLVIPAQASISCGSHDGGSRCVPLTAEAQVRYCNSNTVANVNTGADWSVSPGDGGLQVIDGLACFVGTTCPPSAESYTVTSSYGGKSGQATVTVN